MKKLLKYKMPASPELEMFYLRTISAVRWHKLAEFPDNIQIPKRILKEAIKVYRTPRPHSALIVERFIRFIKKFALTNKLADLNNHRDLK